MIRARISHFFFIALLFCFVLPLHDLFLLPVCPDLRGKEGVTSKGGVSADKRMLVQEPGSQIMSSLVRPAFVCVAGGCVSHQITLVHPAYDLLPCRCSLSISISIYLSISMAGVAHTCNPCRIICTWHQFRVVFPQARACSAKGFQRFPVRFHVRSRSPGICMPLASAHSGLEQSTGPRSHHEQARGRAVRRGEAERPRRPDR